MSSADTPPRVAPLCPAGPRRAVLVLFKLLWAPRVSRMQLCAAAGGPDPHPCGPRPGPHVQARPAGLVEPAVRVGPVRVWAPIRVRSPPWAVLPLSESVPIGGRAAPAAFLEVLVPSPTPIVLALHTWAPARHVPVYRTSLGSLKLWCQCGFAHLSCRAGPSPPPPISFVTATRVLNRWAGGVLVASPPAVARATVQADQWLLRRSLSARLADTRPPGQGWRACPSRAREAVRVF